ncbi:hypothetical protein L195_g051039, partial [Trifolium pratense]
KKRGKNAVDNTDEQLRSKRKIKNPNNNNTVAAVENVDVQQEPTIEDFAAEYLEVTRHTNQLLTQICKKLDVIVEVLTERSNENLEEGRGGNLAL